MAMSLHSSGASQPTKRVGGIQLERVSKKHTHTHPLQLTNKTKKAIHLVKLVSHCQNPSSIYALGQTLAIYQSWKKFGLNVENL